MIRPSSLSIAEHCELAPVLAREFDTTSANIERGNFVDKEITRELLGGDFATDPDARACCDRLYAEGYRPGLGNTFVQHKVSLCDPVTGETITEGTPDFVWLGENSVTVIDFKKREQYHAGLLPEVDRSLQLHAYALAWALRSGATTYKLAYLLFGEGDAAFSWSREFVVAEMDVMLDRMRRIEEKDRGHAAKGTRPRPTKGPHCLQCYQRTNCPSWLLPAHEGPETALVPLQKPGGLTHANAPDVLMVAMALKDASERAMSLLKCLVQKTGEPVVVGDREWGPRQMSGKRGGISASDLDKLGLSHLAKVGRPYEMWTFGKRRQK